MSVVVDEKHNSLTKVTTHSIYNEKKNTHRQLYKYKYSL